MHHADVRLCGHRVLSDICAALAVGVLRRRALEWRNGRTSSRSVFLGRGEGRGVEGAGGGLEGGARGMATRRAIVRHTSAAGGLPAVL